MSDKLKSKVKSVYDEVLMPSKLEKARIFIFNSKNVKESEIKVQFNPAEYSISRSTRYSRKRAVGEDYKDKSLSVLYTDPATLSLRLYFDTISDESHASARDAYAGLTQGEGGLGGRMKSMASSLGAMASPTAPLAHKDPAGACDDINRLVKFSSDDHEPKTIQFIWGTLQFRGKLISSNVTYMMFSGAGKPVRARVDLSIYGEESELLSQTLSKPFESPDRTKERTLTEGDHLWRIANDEYGDPSQWKVIAASNGVLNPRKLGGAMRLKVPSIR